MSKKAWRPERGLCPYCGGPMLAVSTGVKRLCERCVPRRKR